jgi:hypothetical protein
MAAELSHDSNLQILLSHACRSALTFRNQFRFHLDRPTPQQKQLTTSAAHPLSARIDNTINTAIMKLTPEAYIQAIKTSIVILVVGEYEVPIHSALLALYSEYFALILSKNNTAKTEDGMRISCHSAMHQLIVRRQDSSSQRLRHLGQALCPLVLPNLQRRIPKRCAIGGVAAVEDNADRSMDLW